MTNAIKYVAGTITVTLESGANGHVLSVVDEGQGLPVEFDPARAGLGMKVVSALVQQLRGRLVWGAQRSGGARISVLSPELDIAAPG